MNISLQNKTVLIIGGGILQVPLIETAKSMGLKTIVADINKSCEGFKVCDITFEISTRDIEGVVREVKKLSQKVQIDGVLTAGTDASMTVSAAANALGLPGIRYVDAEAASNKIKMRKRLQKAQIPIPKFAPVWNIKDAREALDFLDFPLVLKPADNMGARGVVKINNQTELQDYFLHSKKCSTSGEMILEEFMEGPEFSVDALSWKGNFEITGIADRIITGAPYFIEMGHNMPSSYDKSTLTEIKNIMIDGMKALGITIGAGKGDIKLTKDGVKVGEIAARLSGGFMSSHTYLFSTGVNLNQAILEIALGKEPSNIKPTLNKVSIERSLLASSGKLEEIRGIEEAKKIHGVNDLFVLNKVGDIIQKPKDNIQKTAHIVITAENLEKAEEIFQIAQNTVKFVSNNLYSLSEKEIQQNARQKFGKEICYVCKACDGTTCASGVPGMGGLGDMNTFKDNSVALSEYYILPRYIRKNVNINEVKIPFLNTNISFPMMAAPMTGINTNMKLSMDEYDYALTVLKASMEFGTIGWLGDGASPNKYLKMIDALKQVNGHGILICKPREDELMLKERFKKAEEVGAIAVGIDIDAINFKTMSMKNLSSIARETKHLKRIRELTKLPFILKGIMSAEDAKKAVQIGADAIIVSNHGGRVLDGMPGTARVLPSIKEAVKNESILIGVDGGVRSGMDVFKMLALGANFTLVGRPIGIYGIGGGVGAIKFLYQKYYKEFIKTMNLTGLEKISDITQNYLVKKC